jgi:hypothetical protein
LDEVGDALTMSPRSLTALLSTVLFFLVSPLSAQWTLSVAVGSDRFWGGSQEIAPERKSFRPYRPTVLGLGLEHRGKELGFGLALRYTAASLGLEGPDAVVAAEGAFTVIGVAPEVSYRIATLGPGNRLLIHLGPLVEVWHPVDEEWRVRAGGQAAVSLVVPVGGRFGLSLGANVAVIASPFRADELLDQYDLRPLWRRGVAAGLQYQL